MKIQNIRVENFLGVGFIDLRIDTPISVFAGGNAAGKSSLQQAIRIAMTGEAARVTAKGDYDKMIRDGHKSALVQVRGEGFDCRLTLPKPAAAPLAYEALPFLLDPTRITRMTADKRKAALMQLTDTKVSPNSIAERLVQKGADPQKVEALKAMLRSGFEPAERLAKEKASEARGAWKAITGETYGSQKAEVWKPVAAQEAADHDTAELGMKVSALNGEIRLANQELGSMRAQIREEEKQADQREMLNWKISEVTEADLQEAAKLASALSDIDAASQAKREQQQLLTCPKCKEKLELHNGSLLPHNPRGKVATVDSARDLDAERKSVGARLAIMQRKIAEASKAKQQLEALPVLVPISTEQYSAVMDRLQKAEMDLRIANEKLLVASAARQAEEKAKLDADKAGVYHQDVKGWTLIADALGPKGIPTEILSQALDPINDLLRSASTMTGWLQPRITADIEIEADGRPFALLSESEQWRIEAMLAVVIGQISKLRMLMLDRFDVLDIPSRGQLIRWLMQLADEGQIDQALVFGTMKPAERPATKHITWHWLERGELVQVAEQQGKAA